MSTHSIIAYKTPEGKYRGIYCQFDGYPSHNGKILKEHYTDPDKIKQLIDLGNLSSLEANVHPKGSNHNYRTPEKGVCVYYVRDRGDDWEDEKPVEDDNLQEFLEYLPDVPYLYLFENGKWLCNNVEMG